MANVTIPVSSSDTTEGMVSPSSLTFTGANWGTQTVTVTGVNDEIVDGNVVYKIVLGSSASGDTKYNGVDPADVSVTNTDGGDAYPTVESTNPGSGTTGVAINTFVTATFSEAMGTSTINKTTFVVSDGTSFLNGAVSLNSAKTATFAPANALSFMTNYTAVLTTGVKDAAGDAMQQNYRWTFTTTAGTPTVTTSGTVTGITTTAVISGTLMNATGYL